MKNNYKNIHFTTKAKVHFMGIGGSGMAGVAEIASKVGYKVTGCDLQESTFYSKQLKGIDIYQGHSDEHLKGNDLLVISPAIYYAGKDQSEFLNAKHKMTWQEFMGKYLMTSKEVIGICGTHGKSTTTAMVAELLENAGSDFTAMVGAILKKWDKSYRVGKGKTFLVEADEFNDNFLNYKCDYVVLNNIEYDHPDYFKNEQDMFVSFKIFIENMIGKKQLIVNQDSIGVVRLLKSLDPKIKNNLHIYGYTLNSKPLLKLEKSIKAVDLKMHDWGTSFKADGHSYNLNITGAFNISNALGAILLADLMGIETQITQNTLKNYKGIGRRLDLVGSVGSINIYDDYAHHPTAIKATLSALRQKYKKNKIWAIVEPHSYSRTKALMPEYKDAFGQADCVIIAPIFKARDLDNLGITEKDVLEVIDHPHKIFIDSFNKITEFLMGEVKSSDIVVVMGAGISYQLSKKVLESFTGLNKLDQLFKNGTLRNIRENISLNKYTSIKIGGKARYFIEVKDIKTLKNIMGLVKKYRIPHFIMAGGSNLLVGDKGYAGLVIRINTQGIIHKNNLFEVMAGQNLQSFIEFVIDQGYQGIEGMSWIPGTLGGAIYGNAGAYGQTISDHLVKVVAYDGKNEIVLSKKECEFSYRNSIFKTNGLIILKGIFEFPKGNKKDIEKKSQEIIAIRKEKFPLSLKCPGSFFKNIESDTISDESRKLISPDKIVYGKIPAGYLLETVGAKSAKLGNIEVSSYHGNLFINRGHGKASDLLKLANLYKNKVYKKYGIELKPEVQFLGNIYE